ncbi:hypothetical protein L3Q82_003430 [Scortum barcoo]|uniref:Uncharacterized protein n=1 Tax=Scortum barcoo TaxID=214431 RepID=A0ACB8VPD8_9TELE|nr:hypothetical protein L3Q82_003430 [Scortum barcoo]
MKTMERLLLHHLRPQTHHALDPLQFAYREKTGVEDAIIFLLHRSLSHLDRGSGAVRITFLDFSSAFNTIQPLLLRDKLTEMGVESHLVAWITDYLTGRPQSGQEDEYRELIKDFITWCDSNHLLLNTTKTREMVVDFRRPQAAPESRSSSKGTVWRWYTPTNTWRWSPEKESALRDCFNTTVWDVLMNPHGEDIEGMTHCLTDYLNFCADVVSPVKTVRCYPNNKPWVTREVKTVLNKKKGCLQEQRQGGHESSTAGGETLCKGSRGQLQEEGGAEAEGKQHEGGQRTAEEAPTRPRKAAGPDKVCPRLLKTCAAELGEPLQRIFNLSLQIGIGRVPTLWKTSRIVPVPKKNRPSELNDFRPVALTSHLMKTLERLFLSLLRPQVQHAQDRLQFAYQPGVGVEDAILYLLHRAHSHLDKGSGTVRILFLDFSSAFNTIQPTLLPGQTEQDGSGPPADGLDLRLPHWQTTVRRAEGHHV